MSKTGSCRSTVLACYVGYVVQAVIVNFPPLLFLTYAAEYGISLEKLALIPIVSFVTQMGVDFLSSFVMDKIGVRRAIVGGHVISFLGLVVLALLPDLVNASYGAVLLGIFLCAIGSGINEVLVSPIVEACPMKNKAGQMSLLHSFYCWGAVATIGISTAFFTVFGLENRRILILCWAVLPLVNAFLFAKVPIYPFGGNSEPFRVGNLLKKKEFLILMVMMICAGAAEQSMAQWASAFAEAGLHVSKTVGDVAGPCAFAVMMAISRTLYGLFGEGRQLKTAILGSSVLCVICYALAVAARNPILGLLGMALCGFSVGIFWPGTFSTAAERLPGSGTALYALLALGGDIGCTLGPAMTGFFAGKLGGNLKNGLAFSVLFPILIFIFTLILKGKRDQDEK